MCGNCEGESYRGVRALFNGDLQTKGRFIDRAEWTILSEKIAIYIGESALSNEQHPLYRACDTAISSLTINEHTALNALSKKLGRPAFGNP